MLVYFWDILYDRAILFSLISLLGDHNKIGLEKHILIWKGKTNKGNIKQKHVHRFTKTLPYSQIWSM